MSTSVIFQYMLMGHAMECSIMLPLEKIQKELSKSILIKHLDLEMYTQLF